MWFVNPKMTDGRGRDLKAEVGSPVNSHRVPRWLRQRLGRKVVDGVWHTRIDLPGANMIVYHHGERPYWLDHWGSTDRNGREVFVSEPYGLGEDHLRQLAAFCQALILDFDIRACSYHYPTSTLRITMWPRDWGRPPEWSKPEGVA